MRSTKLPLIVYVLMLVSVATLVTGAAGAAVAWYSRRKTSDHLLVSHYTFQIWTFGLLLVLTLIVVFFLLRAPFIGFALMVFVIVWLCVRCCKGLVLLDREQEIPNPTTLLF